MSRKWSEVEALAVKWRETGEERLLEGLVRRLTPFGEGKIQAFLAAKGLHGYLDLYGQEIRSAAMFCAWRALQTWRPELSSLAHYLSMYASAYAGRLLGKIRLDTVSLSDPLGEDEEQTWEDVLPADTPGPEEALARRTLQEALSGLPGPQREVLKRRFEGLTLEEVGQGLGLSRERVRQLEALAILSLKSDVKKAS